MKQHLNRIINWLVLHIRLFINLLRNLCTAFFSKFNKTNYHSIPIIICNFNRLDYLKRMISSLKEKGYNNLLILDNASTYPPLLNYYTHECNVPVYYLDKNYGHTALWDAGIINQFKKDYFVYSDPDLVFSDNCPNDILLKMLSVLKKHPSVDKIAASLKIDDIPDEYPLKNKVLKNEQRFYERMAFGCYIADVDTTFALYTPHASAAYHDDDFILRTPIPYQMRHLPWYQLEETEEDRYYKSHKIKEIGWWVN